MLGISSLHFALSYLSVKQGAALRAVSRGQFVQSLFIRRVAGGAKEAPMLL